MRQAALNNRDQTEASPTANRRVEVKIMRGIGASQGVAVAPCRVIRKPEDLEAAKKGEIAVCPTALPWLVQNMAQLKGLVTEAGGRPTIAAHYARGYRIPHVAGVSDIMAAVTDGQIIRIDGLKGTVILL
jgi:phosphoenolpyruvate synthase/pyruvate phosphate dikinase